MWMQEWCTGRKMEKITIRDMSSLLKICAFSVTNGTDSYQSLYRLLLNNRLQKAAI